MYKKRKEIRALILSLEKSNKSTEFLFRVDNCNDYHLSELEREVKETIEVNKKSPILKISNN